MTTNIDSENANGSDINGRAATIECYLDLRLPDRPPAMLQWTNRRKESDVYHGALKYKETYVEPFVRQTAASIRESDYDATKIEYVLDALIHECRRLATSSVDD